MRTRLRPAKIIFIYLMVWVAISMNPARAGDLDHKLMMGYQGWFLARGDGSPPNQWRHWFSSTTVPTANNLTVDIWPDMSEYSQTYPVGMSYPDGTGARLFSSYDRSTVMTHFKWMRDYNVYGVYLQRFLGEAVNDLRFFKVRNTVLDNVKQAADIYDRHFAIMYDLSGVPDDGQLDDKLINDWKYLVDHHKVTEQDSYVRQKGRPVVALWGIGFRGRGLNPATFAHIIDWFQNSAPPKYRAYVVGGVPGGWRTLSDDSASDPRWADVYRSLDMLSPWTVGRYGDLSGADRWKRDHILPDQSAASEAGADYMPVIWPGFSWSNLHDDALNQIPRRGGDFYWRQAYNAVDAGAGFIYVAMFDEVDEGTAMFKLAETRQDSPAQANLVTLDQDGQNLPADWYLRLAGETQRMLDGSRAASREIPIRPGEQPRQPADSAQPGNDSDEGSGQPVGKPQNPLITQMFTADPSAHVWKDGRLYVYPSHDIAPPRGADLMDQYHVFSTDDMIHWKDHGEILRAGDVPWGRPEGGFMWAPDAAYKNGTYYFYFPHPSGSDWNNTWKIGVATSDKPASGFTVQGYIHGLDPLIDPAVFVDDDGQAYLYIGGGGTVKGGKLKDNMMEVGGQMRPMEGLVDFHEATWVHKRNGVYYLSYSDNHDTGDAHNRLRYATSDSPLGPWHYQGIYMDPTDSYTNHGSIVKYKGHWWAFYHNSILSGNDWLRSIAVDELHYNPDGTIQKVIQTKGHGQPYQGSPQTIPGLIEAEDFDEGGQGVAFSDADDINHGGQYRDTPVDIGALPGGGFNIGWVTGSEWLEYTVDVAQSGRYLMEARVATESKGGSSLGLSFDGDDKTGAVAVPDTGNWQTYTRVHHELNLSRGKHIMRLRMGDSAFNIDSLRFSLQSAVNTAPQVSAGEDRQLQAGSRNAILQGSGSDPEGDSLTYRWTQQAGPVVTLHNAASARATVSGLHDGERYRFRLQVSDGAMDAQDDVVLDVAGGDPSGDGSPEAGHPGNDDTGTGTDGGIPGGTDDSDNDGDSSAGSGDPTGGTPDDGNGTGTGGGQPAVCAAVHVAWTNTALVIDQHSDSIWRSAATQVIASPTVGRMNADASGTWRALTTDKYLYVRVDVTDSHLINDSGNWWDDDSVELFIDADNSKQPNYDGKNDYQLGFRWDDPFVHVGNHSRRNTGGIDFSMHATGDGYWLEVALPWSTLGVSPEAGGMLGLDVAVDDDDNGGGRDSQVSAFARNSTGWNNPRQFGSVPLAECAGKGDDATDPLTNSGNSRDNSGGHADVGGGSASGGPLENGQIYRFTVKHSGKVLDVSGISRSPGADVHQWTYQNGDNQHWQTRSQDSGYWQLRAVHSGQCLTVADASVANGANIRQEPCRSGNAAQQFRLEALGGDYFNLRARHSDKCVDVSNVSQRNGASVHQWQCMGQANARWRPDPVM